jgi:hypothetical protein
MNELNHLYIVWSIVRDEARDPRGSYTLIARCTACGRVVGCKDVRGASRTVFDESQICKWHTTKNGIHQAIKLAKQEFSQNKLNATKEETH